MSGELLPVAGAEPEGGRGVGDRELDAVGGALEAIGEVAHQQERGRPEGRQPERLGVPGAGVVAEHVEHGIGPGRHAECAAGHRVPEMSPDCRLIRV